ncbi:histidine phosphatase family protein [Kitasatospora sp. NPDC004799]|uniref:histidine phosphatase family protein n=1 Tax=Kitasatospora sp. NPDC004799 TaxID=3154460 RepID=UPI0033AC0A69
MTVRVIFISPAIGTALRQARFDDDGPLDEGGLRSACAAASALPGVDRVLVSPSTRCRQTADALGLAAAEVAPALRGCAMGRWRGRTLDELSAEEPEAVLAWLTDPAAAPHGGESVRQLCARVARWLDEASESAGRLLVVAEPDVIRAAALHVLGAPEQAFWRLDVPPLSGTELTGRTARWNLRLASPLTRREDG